MKYLKRFNESTDMKITCGVYLFDKSNRLLIQHPTNFRPTVWGVPKGRFDKNETDVFEVCKRELMEETGIKLEDYNIINKKELETARYNNTNKYLKSYFVQVDADLSNFDFHCESMVYRDGKAVFPEVDEWKWVTIDEADKIFDGDRMTKDFQKNNLKRCYELLSPINISESLTSDFENKVKELGSQLGEIALSFSNQLSGNLKGEFIYRLTNDEDIIDLLEEFIDRVELDPANDFKFRSTVMFNKIENVEKNPGVDLILRAEFFGPEKVIEMLQEALDDKFDPHGLIEIIKDGIEVLIRNQDLCNWTYQKEQNINQSKIDAGNDLIKKLSEMSGYDFV